MSTDSEALSCHSLGSLRHPEGLSSEHLAASLLTRMWDRAPAASTPPARKSSKTRRALEIELVKPSAGMAAECTHLTVHSQEATF